MSKKDHDRTCWIAEIALDRAQPLLRFLDPITFGNVNVAHILSDANIVIRPDMPYAMLRSNVASALDRSAAAIMPWIETFPITSAQGAQATTFWRGMFPELRGDYSPAFLEHRTTICWSMFVDAYRGRAQAIAADQPWLAAIQADAEKSEHLYALIKEQRRKPLTSYDRSIYARFGWNDHGDMPGLALIYEEFSLRRTLLAWRAAQDRFDDRDQAIILDAARRILTAEAEAAREMTGESIADAATAYGVTSQDIADSFYKPQSAHPLAMILAE